MGWICTGSNWIYSNWICTASQWVILGVDSLSEHHYFSECECKDLDSVEASRCKQFMEFLPFSQFLPDISVELLYLFSRQFGCH